MVVYEMIHIIMSNSSKVEAPNTSSIATYVNMPLTKEQLKEKVTPGMKGNKDN